MAFFLLWNSKFIFPHVCFSSIHSKKKLLLADILSKCTNMYHLGTNMNTLGTNMHPSGIIMVQKCTFWKLLQWQLLSCVMKCCFRPHWIPSGTKKLKHCLEFTREKVLQTEHMVWNIFINTVMWSPNKKKAKYSQATKSLQQERKNNFILYMVYIFIWLFAGQFLSINSCEATYLLTFFHHMKWNINKIFIVSCLFTVTHNFFLLQYMSKLKK